MRNDEQRGRRARRWQPYCDREKPGVNCGWIDAKKDEKNVDEDWRLDHKRHDRMRGNDARHAFVDGDRARGRHEFELSACAFANAYDNKKHPAVRNDDRGAFEEKIYGCERIFL